MGQVGSAFVLVSNLIGGNHLVDIDVDGRVVAYENIRYVKETGLENLY
jgi:hypothetical protein